VELLLQAGASLEVTDGLGNTPLHNAVLYYPSTQHTVDMLLEKGANVSAMNYEGSTPLFMADDKDLKIVLRQLKKAAEKKSTEGNGAGYTGSPDLRKMVFDKKLLEERNSQNIIVKYNSPVAVKSPGLLKRKRARETEDLDESVGRKRIRFCEQDSTGADIDPQFSDEEEESKAGDQEFNNTSENKDSDINDQSKEVPTETSNIVLNTQETAPHLDDSKNVIVTRNDAVDDESVTPAVKDMMSPDPSLPSLFTNKLMSYSKPPSAAAATASSSPEPAIVNISDPASATSAPSSELEQKQGLKQPTITSFFQTKPTVTESIPSTHTKDEISLIAVGENSATAESALSKASFAVESSQRESSLTAVLAQSDSSLLAESEQSEKDSIFLADSEQSDNNSAVDGTRTS